MTKGPSRHPRQPNCGLRRTYASRPWCLPFNEAGPGRGGTEDYAAPPAWEESLSLAPFYRPAGGRHEPFGLTEPNCRMSQIGGPSASGGLSVRQSSESKQRGLCRTGFSIAPFFPVALPLQTDFPNFIRGWVVAFWLRLPVRKRKSFNGCLDQARQPKPLQINDFYVRSAHIFGPCSACGHRMALVAPF
jgi:hypothetical protein